MTKKRTRQPDYEGWEKTDELGTIKVTLTRAVHAEVGHVEIATGRFFGYRYRLGLDEAKKLYELLGELLSIK